jgi:hypothetical protein
MVKCSGKQEELDDDLKEALLDPLEDVDYSDQYKFLVDENSGNRGEYNVKAFYERAAIPTDPSLISGKQEDSSNLYDE